jgi:integrase
MREANPERDSQNLSDPVASPQNSKRRTQVLTLEQARQFLVAAKSDPLEALYVLALTTGMRWGDLLTLKWEDVDLTDSKREEVKTIPQKGQGVLRISERKTKIGRCIVLTTLALEALTCHRLLQDEQRLAKGSSWEDHGLIFCNAGGHPLEANNVRRHSFVPLRVRASLPFLRFHDLRPSAIHLLLVAGAHPRVVQEMFGYRHSSMTVEVNISSSELLSLQEEAVQRLNALLLGEQQPVFPSE